MSEYGRMKNTNIPWIGPIPDSWTFDRVGRTTYVKGRIGWKNLRSEDFIDEGPFLITGQDFQSGKVNWESCYHVDQDRYEEDPYIIVREQDVLITKDGTIGKVSYIDKLPGPTTLNSGIFVTRPLRDSYLSKFFYWIISSPLFTEFVNYNSSGSTILHLYQNVFERFFFPIPPLHEQLLISKFLDKRIRQIDLLIEKVERKIELLKEQRISLINQCVTKGLNPNVEITDSGVEWIGEIPRHWDLKKLKYVSTISLGKMLDQKKTNGDLKPYLGGTNILDDSFDLSVLKEMYFTQDDEKKYQILKNDIFVLEGGDIGRSSIWEDDTPDFYFQKSLNRIRVLTGVPRYVFYSLKTIYDLGYYDRVVERVSIPHLTSEKLLEIKIPFPPSYEEQKLICDHIRDQVLCLDQRCELEEQKIELMKEYRQSLISSVVTGKIRVTEDMV